MITPAATPTPIPALAPVDSPPELGEDVADCVCEVVEVGEEGVVVAEVAGGS